MPAVPGRAGRVLLRGASVAAELGLAMPAVPGRLGEALLKVFGLESEGGLENPPLTRWYGVK